MKVTGTDAIVIDASVALTWCFPDEKSASTERIFERMGEGLQVWVPAIWTLEMANALLVSERRGRLTASESTAFLNRLSLLEILIDPISHDRVFDSVLNRARQSSLSVYDAAYIELAMRKGLPLATLDENMKKAAKSLGIPAA